MKTDVLQQRIFDWTGEAQSTGVRVIGVGGAGCRAVAELQKRSRGVLDIGYIDTDSTSLARAVPGESVLLGAAELRGFGSGNDTEAARRAAEASSGAIQHLMSGAECVLVVAGLGGGTGSGAVPVVASIARELRALVVAVAVMPFEFEGIGRHLQAAEALDSLRKVSDALLETPSGQDGCESTLSAAIERDRAHIYRFVSAITSVADSSSRHPELTAAHLRSVLRDGAPVVFGTGEGLGLASALEAANICSEAALSSRTSTGAINRAVVLIESGLELTASQVATAMATIESCIGSEVELHMGTSRSRQMTGRVRISMIGTQRQMRRPLIFDDSSRQGIPAQARRLSATTRTRHLVAG